MLFVAPVYDDDLLIKTRSSGKYISCYKTRMKRPPVYKAQLCVRTNFAWSLGGINKQLYLYANSIYYSTKYLTKK